MSLLEETAEHIKQQLRPLLIKTFAQAVDFGSMCEECCSNNSIGLTFEKINCEMSEKPLEPDDHCPQQLLAIDSFLEKLDTQDLFRFLDAHRVRVVDENQDIESYILDFEPRTKSEHRFKHGF